MTSASSSTIDANKAGADGIGQDAYDAVIIGAGHNGLICAAYLAKAGWKVLVVERRHVIGGAAVTEELWPGIRVSVASYMMSLLQPRIIQDLELAKYGYKLLPNDFLFTPLENGDAIYYHDDLKRTCEEIARFSKRDAEVFPAYDKHLQEAAKAFRQFLWTTPPNLSSYKLRDLKDTLDLLMQVRRLGDHVYRLADFLTLSVSDYLDRWFTSDAIKGVLSYYSGIGNFAGPRTPGSAYVQLHHLMGDTSQGAGGWGFIQGGMGAVSNAIASSLRANGGSIATDVPVKRVLVSGNRAVGVELENGRVIKAKKVISNADAKATFLRLVDARELPDDFLEDIRNYKTKSSTFKINLAMRELPQYTAFDANRAGRAYPTYMHVAPSLDYLERAYDDAKYGRPSEKPYMTVVAPSVFDKTLAPEGTYVINIFGGHAPYHLRDGDWETEREPFYQRVIDTWADYAPNVKDAIIHAQVLVPPDLERIIGLTGGNIFQGDLSLDQLFILRPAAKYANYRSPIEGLYTCGSSNHPGGGVMGVAGYNAAREIMRDGR
ncbi:phytoene desaturase family protein [Rhodoligotrophos defluvii]|uniref:phytoene desaturase family protein n=1 Tax=Rhodoligotrophos defluvii TaxID=2561934 RepID=UPI0010C99BE2|nr:NAD(P)/FAD-dependent oxidoreductase [Rhodoligotrophos defluvii]